MTTKVADVERSADDWRASRGLDVWTPLGRRFLLGLVIPVLLAGGWELAVRFGYATGRLLPPPSKIWVTATDLWQSGELVRHAEVTTARVFVGFVIGTSAGTALGAISASSRLLRRLLDPTLQALRAIPSVAWVPLFILWLGIFEASKVTLIGVGVFFPVYLGVLTAILNVDRKTVEVGHVFRLSRAKLITRILLPAILPQYLTSLRSGLGLGWMFVVAAEFMGASEGLGYLLVDGQQTGKPAQIITAILAFAIVGKLSDQILVVAFAPLLKWRDRYGSDD